MARVPNILANGVGNVPDADKLMANFDWLTNTPSGTITVAGMVSITSTIVTVNGTTNTYHLKVDSNTGRGGAIGFYQGGVTRGGIGVSGVILGTTASDIQLHSEAAINFSSGGGTTGVKLTSGNQLISVPAGSAAAPSICLGNTTNNGFYYAATNDVGIVANGSLIVEVTSSKVIFGQPVLHPDGVVGTPSISFGSEQTSGLWRQGAGNVALSCSGARIMDWSTTFIRCLQDIIPNADNTQLCGKTGARWSAVWSATATIQTSHSDFKYAIRDISEVRVPRGVFYRWKDRQGRKDDVTVMGWLADDLPAEAFEKNEDGTINKTGVHTNAVLGELCAGWHNHERRIAELEKELARLRAA